MTMGAAAATFLAAPTPALPQKGREKYERHRTIGRFNPCFFAVATAMS